MTMKTASGIGWPTPKAEVHDHEDRVRYWLTDAEGGGQPIPDKVFMVMSRPHQKSIIV